MDCGKAKGGKKGGLMLKTWKRCKSLSSSGGGGGKRVGPEGCLSIYVGPEKERFVMKTEYVNHPLFKILLEEAESEYGYTSHGPLMLPCQVHHFINILMQMEMDHRPRSRHQAGCNFVAASSPRTTSHTTSNYHLLTQPT